MTYSELLPPLSELNHADKLRVVQFLVTELARESEALLSAEQPYPVWSPHTAFSAADALLAALAEERQLA